MGVRRLTNGRSPMIPIPYRVFKPFNKRIAMKSSVSSSVVTVSASETKLDIEKIDLAHSIITLSEKVKELETLLADKKKRLSSIMKDDEVLRVKDDTEEHRVIEVKFVDKTTKTLQKPLVEENHGITVTDSDYKITFSHYISVAKVKA